MLKKILSILVVFLSFLVINVEAEIYDLNSIPNRSYVIGKHLYTRDSLDGNAFNGEYQGVLETRWLIFGSSSIESTNLLDMIVYYKNPEGVFLDAANDLVIDEDKLPEYFEIEYLNGNKIENSFKTSIVPNKLTENNYLSLETKSVNIEKYDGYDVFKNYIEDDNTTNRGSSKLTFKVAKDFIGDKDNYYDITIKYFDAGLGTILLQVSNDYNNTINYGKTGYGGYVEEPWWTWGNGYYLKNMSICLTNTNTWKTYTFRVGDTFFEKNIDNYLHFYFGTNNKNTSGEVINIREVIVTKKVTKILSIDKNTDNNEAVVGNIYTDSDFGFGFKVLNIYDENRTFNISYKILDEDEKTVSEKNLGLVTIPANNQEMFYLDNSLKYGVYKLVVSVNYNGVIENEEIEFSKMIKDLSNQKNDFLGVSSLFGYSTYFPDSVIHDTKKIYQKLGVSIIRNGINGNFVAGNNNTLATYIPLYDILTNEEEDMLMNVWNIDSNVEVASDGIITDSSFEKLKARTIELYEMLANKYKGKIKYYETLCEWNRFSPKNAITPEQYAILVIEISKAVKSIDKNAKIVAMNTNKFPIYDDAYYEDYNLEHVNDYTNYLENSWLVRALKTSIDIDFDGDGTVETVNVCDVIDAISIHPYTMSATTSPETKISLMSLTKELRKLIQDHTDKNIPIWFTETGHPTHTFGASLKLQAAYLTRTLVLSQAMNETANVEKAIIYELQNQGASNLNSEANYGLVNNFKDNSSKPFTRDISMSAKNSYIAINMYSYILNNAKYLASNENTYETDNYLWYKFKTNDNKEVIVAWIDEQENISKNINLNVNMGKTTIYDIYGNTLNSFVNNKNTINVDVSYKPIYIVTT